MSENLLSFNDCSSLMEKDNKKAREDARKEYNDAVKVGV